MKKINSKKGVSPVVATILLIAIVIILATIIFFWARAFVIERAQKFGRAVELSCSEVNFEAGVFCESEDCFLDIVNRGDIPIYGFEIKDFTNPGTVLKKTTLEQGTITIGQTTSIYLDVGIASGDKLLVVPKILGETDSGKAVYTCTDNFGFLVGVP